MRESARPLAAVALLLVACVVAWFLLDEGCSPPDDVPAVAAAAERAAPPAPPPPPAPTVPETPKPAPAPPPQPAVQPAPEAPPPSAPVVEEGVVVEGRVTDTAGAPIAGAKVVATTLRPLADRGAKPPARGAATSGADGTFRARLPKGTALADVAASATGFASASVERIRVGASVEIRLEREGVLVGRVLDPDGKPIAGASVRLFRVLGHEQVDTATDTTSAEGEYRIGGFGTVPWKNPFKEPRSIVLDVRAAGFAASQEWGPFTTKAGATTLRDVVLRPARPLTVDVTDSDSGAPIAGARVTIGFHATGLEVRGAGEDPSWVPHPAPYVDEGVSDERGVCVLANAPARLTVYQRLLVRAWKKGFTAEVVVVTARPLVNDERVELRLWPSATVKGRVVDADGAPVAGATVKSDGLDKLWDVTFAAPLGDRPWGGTFRTTGAATDADGRYLLPGVRASAAGAAIAYVWTMGRREPLPDGRFHPIPFWGKPGERPPGVELRLRAGEETTAADIVVAAPKATSAAQFVVVDADGRPVAGARLEDVKAVAWAVWTDADGRATMRWPAEAEWFGKPETEPVVSVAASGFVNAVARCRPDVKFPPEVRVVLVRGIRLEGRVREPDGRPAAGWTVTAWRSQPEHLVFGGAQTASDGTFAIDGVPSGAVGLEVSHVGDMSDMGRQLQFDGAVAGGAPVDVVLKTETTKFGSLVVTKVDALDGSPVVESVASINCGGGTYPRGVPGPPGTAILERVPVGTWPVTVSAPGWLPGSATVTIVEGQTTTVRIALVRGTPAVVRLRAPVTLRLSGRPAPVWAARVDAAPGEDGAGFQKVTYEYESDGVTVHFDALPPGRYRLGCAAGAGGSESAVEYVSKSALDVGPTGAATARGTVELVAAGTIAVSVRDAELQRSSGAGAVAPTAVVDVLAVGGERHRVINNVTGGTGAPLLPGAYVVRLLLPSGRVREAQATVRAGETSAVRFDSP